MKQHEQCEVDRRELQNVTHATIDLRVMMGVIVRDVVAVPASKWSGTVQLARVHFGRVHRELTTDELQLLQRMLAWAVKREQLIEEAEREASERAKHLVSLARIASRVPERQFRAEYLNEPKASEQ